jgi:hypothetical protein
MCLAAVHALTGLALNEQHLLTSRAFREGGTDKSAATAPVHSTATAPARPQTIPDGLLEIELSSSLRFSEDDRLHEVQ